jgi:hypothetical protein
MKRLPYILILLLISAQFDDAWALTPGVPSAPLAEDDDNDEYIPAHQRTQDEEPSPRQQPVFDGLKPCPPDFSVVRRGVPSEWNLAVPSPPALYVFMSLQR